MNFKKALLAAGVGFTLPALHAQIVENYSFTPNLAVPDGNGTGVHDVRNITSAINSISDITVSLNISGDFNGDLTLFLRHDSGFTMLLNRVGVPEVNSFGYDDHGFNITLRDDAAHDIHTYQDFATTASGAQVTGLWQPDSRVGNPALGDRSAALASFQGVNANGQWTLFAADLMNGGSTSQVVSWGMQITAVPEPHEYGLAAGLGLIAFAFHRKRKLGTRVSRNVC